jgi:hypothetical protein
MKKFIIVCNLLIFVGLNLLTANPEPLNNGFSGYILDSTSKETLIGASILIKDAKKGAYTNKMGYFSIADIPVGKHEVIISLIGYERKKFTIDVKHGSSIRENIELKPSSLMTDEIFIEAERENEKREISVSKVNIPIQQLKEIRIGGESDVFRSLQFLPGVLTSSQISSGLFVRGGSPDQNLVLIDGSTVYNPSHLFGFISTFNSEAIKDVELIKGGFPAEYGGRLSAVLNITQKDGNKEKFEGLAKIGVISSQFNIEGPLFDGSFFFGARRTYLELVKAVYPEDPEFPLPDFNFYDINAKIVQNITKDDKLFISGFMSADALTLATFGTTMGLDIGNKLASIKWTHIFDDNLFGTLNISASKYINNLLGDQSGYEFIIDNSITDYTAKGALEWFVTDKFTAKFGMESNKYIFEYLQNFTGDTSSTQTDTTGVSTNLTVHQWTHSAFGQLNYNVTDLLSLQAGLRVNYWEISDEYILNPRLAVRYQITENVSAKLAWGLFDQNLRLATQPDFSFFDTWLPTDNTVPISTAEHYIFSLQSHIFGGYKLDFDVYYKNMNNINELNRSALKGQTVADIFYIGDTKAYGAEIFLQKSFGKLNGWVGYALGYISSQFDSINGGEEFRPKYDRMHDFKIVTQYQIDKKFDVGMSFLFQSGQSYTGATSRFQSRLIGQTNGRGKLVNSQLYGLRLPPSHQLNVNGSYKFQMWGLDSKVILDIYNVYNRRDIWFRYYNTREDQTTVEDVRLLPILPTLSLEVKF